MSFFEVEEGAQAKFEADMAGLIAHARDAFGCLSSELVRLDEERRYAWVERWVSREAHNHFNQILFGQLLPQQPDLLSRAQRLTERDAKGYVVR
jgi:quinol monooxygenase YgiN